MKEKIKQILRENVEKNSLGVYISRPDQEMIIMRGIPGAGKSTKAKSLMAEGIIHSTDDVIESMGDYRSFFEKMIKEGDFSALHKAHSINFKNAKESILKGLSPVIIDNTHIKANEAKNYVLEALKMGFNDINIKIVDIGTNGLTAEILAERNTHGVPLDKIRGMIQSYESVGSLTLTKILESKDMFTDSGILYSGVVLDTASRNKLLDLVGNKIPAGWKEFAHHMTIVFGKGVKNKEELGKKVVLTVTAIGSTDKVIAVKVEGYESTNKVPHITVAVNLIDGGKPVMSNDITNWMPIKQFMLSGIVTEVKKQVDNEQK